MQEKLSFHKTAAGLFDGFGHSASLSLSLSAPRGKFQET